MVIIFIHTVVFSSHRSTASHEAVIAANIATMNCDQEHCCTMLAAGAKHTNNRRRTLAIFTPNKIMTCE